MTKNECEQAFDLLAARPDTIFKGTTGTIEIRRQTCHPSTMHNGMRVLTIRPCDRIRWLEVIRGFDTIAQIDQRNFFQDPEGMAAAVMAVIEGQVTIPGETVNSAIRSIEDERQTFVWTSADRWLLVENYRAEREAAAARNDTGPRVIRLRVIRLATQAEFYASCHSDDTPAKADDPEATLRALWTSQGVTQERQEQVLAEVKAAAQPGAKVGPFTIPYREELTQAGPQLVIPGCERQTTTKATAQLSLFA